MGLVAAIAGAVQKLCSIAFQDTMIEGPFHSIQQLRERNAVLKEIAESNEWQRLPTS
jgi:hypothetical protein